MLKIGPFLATLLLVVVLAAPVAAQEPVPLPTPPVAARALDNDLRNQIFVMEGALQRAVAAGARQLNFEIRSVVPNVVMLSGEPQARGVYLEGYGVHFDVGVPILHQSMVWSIGPMLQQGEDERRKLAEMRLDVQKLPPGPNRSTLEGIIARIELQLGIPPTADTITRERPLALGAATAVTAGDTTKPVTDPVAVPPRPDPAAPAPASPFDKKAFQDPNAINRAYTEAVQKFLIDAMIDYSVPMRIAPDEWLSVGARDNMQRDSLAPPDPYEEVVTILLRIRGSDLAAYRAAQIDKDEVRRRVQVREF
jgi:hypothetical protein